DRNVAAHPVQQTTLDVTVDDLVGCRGEDPGGQPLLEAQAQHDAFGVVVLGGEEFGIHDRQLPARDLRGVPGGVFDVVETVVADVRMRAGAGTPPVAVDPVPHVVAAFPAGFGPVGHLVPVEAVGAEALVDHLVAVGVDIVVGGGQLAAADLAGHGGAVLHDEGVGGDMIHVRLEHGVEGFAHIIVGFGG